MKSIKMLCLGIVLMSFTGFARKPHGKLVILIAIDGLGDNVLEKYKPVFSHGFRRMFNEGLYYNNTWDNHAITVSLPGHVTLATGNYPETHGIVDGSFYEKQGDSSVLIGNAFSDANYYVPGLQNRKGISTKRVLTPGLAEWTKNKSRSAKVLCVGTGNISSALYCFHPNDPVYWYDERSGRYITSSYFLKDDPEWVKKFNEEKLPGFLKRAERWDNIVPQKFLYMANADNADFERCGEKHVFPYIAPDSIKGKTAFASWFAFAPFIDNATLALAKQGIEAMSMGQTTGTDYLSVVLSQVDETNHSFGPSSLETLNVLLQMDIALGDFFKYLDEKVGKGNYVVALSADHGFPEIPEQNVAKGKQASRVTVDKVEQVMNEIKTIASNSKSLSELRRQEKIKTYLKTLSFVADAYTSDQLNGKTLSKDKYLEWYKKSRTKDRVPGIPFLLFATSQSEIAKNGMMIRLKENTIVDMDCDVHGSPYNYDRHVPLIFMGMGIKKGVSNARAYTVDVAPSLAKSGGIPVSNHTDGKSLF